MEHYCSPRHNITTLICAALFVSFFCTFLLPLAHASPKAPIRKLTKSDICETLGPVVNVLNPPPVCEGALVTINNVSITGGQEPYSYQWFDGVTPIAGATSAILSTPAPPLGLHNYTLVVTDANGETGSDVVTVTVHCQPHIQIDNPLAVCANTPVSLNTVIVSTSSLLSYQWYQNGTLINGATSQGLNIPNPPVGMTTYSVIVTEQAGCTDSDATVLTVYAPLSVSIPAPSGTCDGGSATLTANVSNASPPLSFQWYNNGSLIAGATSSNYNVGSLSTGTTYNYSVSVTDAHNCPGSGSVSFAVSNPPTVSINDPAPACSGGSVALVSNTSGGTPPYSYEWSQAGIPVLGGNTATLNVTAPMSGSVQYTLQVTDINGCIATDNTAVTTGGSVSISIPPTSVCQGENLIISNANINGGTPPYSYQWFYGGAPIVGANNSILNIPAPVTGIYNYVLQAIDASGCAGSGTASVGVNPQPVVTIEDPMPVCIGTPIVANAAIICSSQPSHQWYVNGNPIPGATSATLSLPNPPVGTTTYTLIVTSEFGCVGQDQTTITVYPNPTANITSSGSTCSGASSTLSANAQGGTAPYSYQWQMNGSNMNGQTSATLNVNSPSGSVTYAVMVTDAHGCSTSDDIVLSGNAPPSISINPLPMQCPQSNATLTSSISGGTPNYSYQWYNNNNPIVGANNSSLNIITPTSGSSQYTLMVTDANGCTDEASLSISVSLPITSNLSLSGSNCLGGQTTITANASGGTPPYSYQWFENGNLVPNASNAALSINNNAATTYSVVVSDSNGCTGTSTVNVAPAGLPTVILNTPASVCAGSSLSFAAIASGGSSFTYQWFSGSGMVSGATSSSYILSNPTAGTYSYTVVVTNASGCTASANASATVYANPSVQVIDPSNVCASSNLILSSNASGGTPNYSYQWYTNNSPISGANASTLNITAPASGSTQYTLMLTDANGCTASDVVTVAPNTNIGVLILSSGGTCSGQAATLNANASGGNGSYNYQWYNNGAIMNGATNSSLSIPSAGAGSNTYSVQVTDSNGCHGSDDIVLTTGNPPTVNINPIADICQGTAITLNAVASGGQASLTYQWYQGIAPIGGNSPSINVTNLSPGNTSFTLVVTDANGCTGQDEANVVVHPNPTANVSDPAPVCGGNAVTLLGSANGGTPSYSYQWYAGANPIASANGSSLNTNAPASGSAQYTFAVTDANGCMASDNATVTATPPISVNIPNAMPVCQGTSITIGDASVNGGVLPYSFQWLHNSSPISGATALTLNIPNAAVGLHTYTLLVTDAAGCTGQDDVSITVNALPTVNINNPASVCTGTAASITSTASAGASLQWYVNNNPIPNATNSTLNLPTPPVGTTTYTLIATSTNGCTAQDQAILTVYPSLNISVSSSGGTCSGQSAVLTAGANNGVAPYGYQWYINGSPISGANASTYNVASAPAATTVYSVMVTDANNCSGSDDITFSLGTPPSVNLNNPTPVCSATTVTLNGTASGDNPPFSYQWYQGIMPVGGNSPSLSLTNPPAGTTTYTLVVTDANGCTGQDETSLTVHSPINASITPPAPACGGSSASIVANVSGGSAPYSYQWLLNGSSVAGANGTVLSLASPPAGTHTITLNVSDANGCQASQTTILTVGAPVSVSIPQVAPICGNGSTMLSALTNGGTGSLSYQWYNNGTLMAGSTTSNINVVASATGAVSYSVVVTDANGCSAQANTTLVVYPLPVINIPTPSAECVGTPISMSANVSSGASPYNYQWYYNGSPVAGASASNYIASGLSIGSHNYSVVVTDANGCSSSAATTAVINEQPTVNINQPASVCAGSSITLIASASGASGLSYQWYANGAPVSGNGSSLTIPNAAAGSTTYSVQVSTASGCAASDDVVLIIYPNPTVNIIDPAPICNGTPTTLSGSANGGTVPYSYQWFSNGSPIAGATSSSLSLPTTPVGNTTYMLQVTDANGCMASDMSTLTVNPSLSVNIPSIAPMCEGSPVSVTASVNGGTSPYSFQWYQGGTMLNGATSATLNLPNAPVGTTVYTLSVIDANGCTGTETVSVSVYDQPQVIIEGLNQVCGNSCSDVTLSAIVTPALPNPSGSYQYLWNTGANTSSITVSPSATATYSVTVSILGMNGCAASDSHTLSVSFLSVNLPDQSICEGNSATLSPMVANASGALSYQWSNGTNGASTSVSPSVNTTYAVTVSDASGCVGFDNAMVTVNRVVQANAGSDLIRCAGGANAITLGSPSVGSTSYSWNTGQNTAQISVSPIQTTTYTLTANNACGTTTDQVIVVIASIVADAGADQMICSGNSATLVASGGTSYAWSNGGSGATISVNPTVTTTYTVTVTDGNGCSDTDSVLVTVGNNANGISGLNIEAICNGGGNSTAECVELSAQITGGIAVAYQWNTGDDAPNISASSAIDEFSVTVTDMYGCTYVVSIPNPCNGGSGQDDVIAVDDNATTPQNTPIAIQVLGNDIGSNISITSVTQPANGSVVVFGGIIQYTPNNGFTGTDSFTYQICDNQGHCDIATVTIVVIGDTNPCDNISTVCTQAITPTIICPEFCNLTGNYSLIVNVSTLYPCAVQLLSNGCLMYTALPMFAGIDTLTIYAVDEIGNQDVATVIVQVGNCTGGIEGGGIQITNDFNGIAGLIGIENDGVIAADSIAGFSGKMMNPDILDIDGINVAPNPAKDFVTVSFVSKKGNTQIGLFDLMGKQLYATNVKTQKGMNFCRVELRGYPAGIYVLKAGDAAAKLVKE